jgi:protein-disulfide isomerase-like protein with CxxC motif
MTLNDVFKVCAVRGVRLVITGGQLRAQGRKGAVNDALRHAITEHRQTIIDVYGDGVWPGTAEIAAMQEFSAPTNARKLIHRWRDRQGTPDVRDIEGTRKYPQ